MRLSLHARIAIGGIAGIAAGTACHVLFRDSQGLAGFVQYVSQPVGQIFLRLLLMLVVPLVFSALALGVAGLGDLRSVGRVGLKTLAYTVCVSTIAVLIGLSLVSLLRPGEGMDEEIRQRLVERSA
jgi:Na+/H+-dicarboxylate symporter